MLLLYNHGANTMPKLELTCPVCKKKADEKSHQILKELSLRIVNLQCGHSYTEKLLQRKNWEELEAQYGAPDHLYPYQGAGYEFARKSGFRALIADEPGLGKTIQTLACLKFHPDELLPCLIIVKSALKLQYMKAIIRWLGMDFMPQIISESSDRPNSMFPITITTYDLLWRMSKKEVEKAEKAEKEIRARLGLSEFSPIPENEKSKVPEIKNHFKEYGYKTVILDECQQIKNPTSKRAQMVREVCSGIPHILASSGTPIKNNAGEYFTILNILRPEKFRNYKDYLVNFCEFYESAHGEKVGGIRDPEYFRQMTEDFIIRRTKSEVLPDLPPVVRKFTECEFASKKMEQDYNQAAEEFSEFFYENEDDNEQWSNILAKMAKLRHKAGLNKIPFVTEQVIEFLLDTERTRKIVIFTHHIDVADMMRASLIKRMKEENINLSEPLMYQSGNMDKRQQVLEDFMNLDDSRILIASTLASGEGVDGLQRVCSDCIIMERQWNPANEEQVEARFSRIGAKGKSEGGSVSANYPLSTGTIDEYFTELVEQKRATMSQVLDGVQSQWDQNSLFKELAETLARKGSKKWRLN